MSEFIFSRRAITKGLVAMAILGRWSDGDARLGGSGSELPHYPAHLADAEINRIFDRAKAELSAKTALNIGTWHMDKARWAVDMEIGLITFTGKDAVARAPVQVIGTRSLADGTFLWARDHPSIPVPLRRHAALVKAFGEQQGLKAMTTRKIEASEEEAWELTALAVHLAGADGAYRGPTDKAEVFMTFGEITVTKA
ncbi:DUF6882 domain-containing protein [Sphingomonas sp. GlSt437]|uniref:DUF6882 domain-containing protein n=1 Tax=Sphingomonas sp. GlSt437 TaxID=3389970 RepID=UPI003A852A92